MSSSSGFLNSRAARGLGNSFSNISRSLAAFSFLSIAYRPLERFFSGSVRPFYDEIGHGEQRRALDSRLEDVELLLRGLYVGPRALHRVLYALVPVDYRYDPRELFGREVVAFDSRPDDGALRLGGEARGVLLSALHLVAGMPMAWLITQGKFRRDVVEAV